MAPDRSCSSRTIWPISRQHILAERQPGINSCRLLADQPGAQHQPVGNDFRLFRRLAQDRQEIAGKAHRQKSPPAARTARAVNLQPHENTSPFAAREAPAARPAATELTDRRQEPFGVEPAICAKISGGSLHKLVTRPISLDRVRNITRGRTSSVTTPIKRHRGLSLGRKIPSGAPKGCSHRTQK